MQNLDTKQLVNNSFVNFNNKKEFKVNSVSNHEFYIGLTLALLSSFFIGSSFILKKKGLLKLSNTTETNTKNQLRASQGGHGYLKEWTWWSGFLTMGVGEICNFVAYMFAPATLVTPLGALSVLISAVMAAYFLDEKLNTIGKIGCILTAIGSVVMVIHAPKEGQIKNVNELLTKIFDTEFISFSIVTMILLFVLIFILAPRYGNTNILIYILICSILGSYTVMSCKGIALGVKEILETNQNLTYFYTFMFVFTTVSCIVIQINYLNKSLDIFNTAIVTTVYYVLFTLFVMIAGALLFKELSNISFIDFVGCMCGFSTIICALCLIHFFKINSDKTTQNLEFKSRSSDNNNDKIEFKTSSLNETNTNLFRYSLQETIIGNNVDETTINNNTTNKNAIKIKPDSSSFVNYLNSSIDTLKSKYLKKNENFGYNYKKLISDEQIEYLHGSAKKKGLRKSNSFATLFKETVSDDEAQSNLIGNKSEED